jgi:cytoskeleton protein RodZ
MSKVTRLSLDESGELSRKRIHLREISGDLDAALETVGQDLHAARLRRGDDLATVSKALKIRKDHLEAIEEDRLEALPGRTYAVGFVRTYADYLGLDAVQCVERYKAEIAGRTEEKEPPPYADDAEERHLPNVWLFLGVLVLLLVVYGAYHLMLSADSMTNQPVTPVPVQMVPKPEALRPAPQTSRAPAQQAPIAQPQKPAQPQAALALPAPEEGATISPPGSQVYGAANANARVVLRARAMTKVLVIGPGQKVLINRVLKPGDSYRVPNLVGVTLTTPDGGALEMDLDGQSMGNAGRRGQMVEALSLDPQAVADRASGQ